MSDWIKWNDGECPVEEDALVDVEFRNGLRDVRQAFGLRWNHNGSDGDIIAYRRHLPRKGNGITPNQKNDRIVEK